MILDVLQRVCVDALDVGIAEGAQRLGLARTAEADAVGPALDDSDDGAHRSEHTGGMDLAGPNAAQPWYYSRYLSSYKEKVTVVSRATSYRLDPALKARLEQQAALERTTERAVLERLLAEGLDTLHHPGIVYRDGPTGRRAALAVGPDVWEVAAALRHTEGTDEQRVVALAEQFDLHPRHVRTAIDFAAVHREEIDAQVAANDDAARRAQRMAEARADLLAS